MPTTASEAPTYSTPDFRYYTKRLAVGQDGKPRWIQVCEELDPETGRWEPFISSWPATNRPAGNAWPTA